VLMEGHEQHDIAIRRRRHILVGGHEPLIPHGPHAKKSMLDKGPLDVCGWHWSSTTAPLEQETLTLALGRGEECGIVVRRNKNKEKPPYI
jgi:hypothetical protein